MTNTDSVHVRSRHTVCIGVAVALLVLFLGATAWLSRVAPALLESYGMPAVTLQFNWTIVPVVLVILGSILVAARTEKIPERRKCYWIVGMVLFFPLSLAALAIRVVWKKET